MKKNDKIVLFSLIVSNNIFYWKLNNVSYNVLNDCIVN